MISFFKFLVEENTSQKKMHYYISLYASLVCVCTEKTLRYGYKANHFALLFMVCFCSKERLWQM